MMSGMSFLAPDAARIYWRTLLDNATKLIADAHLLHSVDSFGRARALTVLAEEELGKATVVYERFSHSWSERSSEPVELPLGSARDHLEKYRAAYEFGKELEIFWGGGYEGHFPIDDEWDRWFAERKAEANAAARAANLEKQRGFYVDLIEGKVLSPADFTSEGVADPLVRAAQVIEMMLITDHTRMQAGDPAHFDDTHEMQWRVMPTAHGEDFSEFMAQTHTRDPERGDSQKD